MNGGEFAGCFRRQTGQFQRYDTKAAFKDHVDDAAGMPFGESVRFDHGKSAIAHISILFWLANVGYSWDLRFYSAPLQAFWQGG